MLRVTYAQYAWCSNKVSTICTLHSMLRVTYAQYASARCSPVVSRVCTVGFTRYAEGDLCSMHIAQYVEDDYLNEKSKSVTIFFLMWLIW